jgi:hypothetical protein
MTCGSTPSHHLDATRHYVLRTPTGVALRANLGPSAPATAPVVTHRYNGGKRKGDGGHA